MDESLTISTGPRRPVRRVAVCAAVLLGGVLTLGRLVGVPVDATWCGVPRVHYDQQSWVLSDQSAGSQSPLGVGAVVAVEPDRLVVRDLSGGELVFVPDSHFSLTCD